MRVHAVTAALLLGGLLCTPSNGTAQWVKYPSPDLPRTIEGKADLAAPAPRSAHGVPDLSGVWQAEGAPIPELMKMVPGGQNGLGEDIPSKYFLNLLADYPRGREPLQPTAAAYAARLAADAIQHDNVGINCLPSGLPLFMTTPAPFKIVQTRGLTVVLSESDNSFRQIFTDGRKLPEDPTPSWVGSSVGHWDGDTFVVDTIGLNGRGQLDAMGHRYSSAMRLTERYTRRSAGRMEAQFTIDDPETFTTPVTVSMTMVLKADTDLIEYVCAENEKDKQRIALQH
jgi:hypothetical protein